jgi:hypothetical protein
MEATSTTLTAASDAIGKQTQAGKEMAVASATINTFLSAQKAYESMVEVPVIGPVLAVAAAAAAVVAGMKNIQSIESTKVPEAKKYAEGGYIGGDISHAMGGVNINAESGEFIVNKSTMQNPQMSSQIVAMNQSKGNNTVNNSPAVTHEDVAKMINAQKVFLVEHDISILQSKVQTRESNFSM